MPDSLECGRSTAVVACNANFVLGQVEHLDHVMIQSEAYSYRLLFAERPGTCCTLADMTNTSDERQHVVGVVTVCTALNCDAVIVPL